MVFTELIEMIESKWGLTAVQKVLDDAALPHGGVYTSVGTYPHGEAVAIVQSLSKYSGMAVVDLLEAFGHYLFNRLAAGFPHLLSNITDPFDLLLNIEQLIHVEVKKLYPDARPPMFHGKLLDSGSLEMVYQSNRGMGALAIGLMKGCGDYFKQPLNVAIKDSSPDGTIVTFILDKQPC
jgi:hypothetical protein